MLEMTINVPFTTVFEGPAFTTPSDAILFLDGNVSSTPFTTSAIPGTTLWAVGFTPVATGVYVFYAFGEIKFRIQCFNKSLFGMITNIEDESLGSWTWDKTTGVLTVLRQNGSALAIHNVVDNQTEASRERVG